MYAIVVNVRVHAREKPWPTTCAYLIGHDCRCYIVSLVRCVTLDLPSGRASIIIIITTFGSSIGIGIGIGIGLQVSVSVSVSLFGIGNSLTNKYEVYRMIRKF